MNGHEQGAQKSQKRIKSFQDLGKLFYGENKDVVFKDDDERSKTEKVEERSKRIP